MSQFYVRYPASGGAASANASVGLNGSTAPTSSTEVAGVNPSGNLQPLQTNSAGDLLVTNTPVDSTPATQNITVVDSSTTTNTYANGQNWYTGAPTAGSAAIFVLSSTETGQLEISGTWTGTLQTEISIDGGVTYVLNSIHQTASALFLSSFTSNVIGSLNLGGKTHFRVRAIATMTGTATIMLRVSQNPVDIYVANAIKIVSSDTNTSPATLTIKPASTAPLATDNAVVVAISPNTPVLPVSGTVTANQGTANATPWNENIAQYGGVNTSLGSKVSASSIPVVIASDQAALPLPTGASTSALQTSGNASLTTIATNSGTQATAANQTTGNASLATIATNTTGVSTSALQTSGNSSLTTIATNTGKAQSGRSSANAPVYNVYSTTNITTGAYVQLVASTTSATNFLDIFDSSGQAMIIGVGASGSEVIQGYVAPGGEQIPLAIPAGSRIAYKALSANATAGYLTMSFYT